MRYRIECYIYIFNIHTHLVATRRGIIFPTGYFPLVLPYQAYTCVKSESESSITLFAQISKQMRRWKQARSGNLATPIKSDHNPDVRTYMYTYMYTYRHFLHILYD